jgi:hypothetical protein
MRQRRSVACPTCGSLRRGRYSVCTVCTRLATGQRLSGLGGLGTGTVHTCRRGKRSWRRSVRHASPSPRPGRASRTWDSSSTGGRSTRAGSWRPRRTHACVLPLQTVSTLQPVKQGHPAHSDCCRTVRKFRDKTDGREGDDFERTLPRRGRRLATQGSALIPASRGPARFACPLVTRPVHRIPPQSPPHLREPTSTSTSY